MEVSILIVSYNTRELTLACLESVFQETSGIQFEVIVIDNASHDGSSQAIADRFPAATLVAVEQNLGFARANNLAAARARGGFLLLLNPDTVILDGAVQKAVAFARSRPDASIVGGRTYFEDRTLNRTSCHGRPTPWSLFCMGVGLSSVFRRSRVFNPEGLGAWQRDTVRDVDVVTGCFLLIKRQLWDQLNGFDESFFMYGEDTDLCVRAGKLGERCYISPDVQLIHYGGQSEAVRADKMVRLFRAKAQLFEKHWSPGAVPFGIAMLKLIAFTRMIAWAGAGWVGRGQASKFEAWRDIWRRRREFAQGDRSKFLIRTSGDGT